MRNLPGTRRHRRGSRPAAELDPGDHSATLARERFRTFLGARVTSARELTWYLDQAAAHFGRDPEVSLAVEELIDHMGRMLGFETRHVDELRVSAWLAPAGGLAVHAVEARAVIGALGGWARVRDELLATLDEAAVASLTGLYVVCGTPNRRLLEEAMRLRRDAWPIRLVTLAGLLGLVRCVEEGRASRTSAWVVLSPASAFADDLIGLFQRGDAAPDGPHQTRA